MANNEWGTPSKYLESARVVMDGIDLDPASNDEAQKRVKANKYYTEDTNGLIQDWHGNVWLNPPYGVGLAKPFVEKLISSYQAGNVEQAIVLTNNVTDTAWFNETLGAYASALCFPSPRIQFETPPNTTRSSNSKGQVFSYIGLDPARFLSEFAQFGLITLPVRL